MEEFIHEAETKICKIIAELGWDYDSFHDEKNSAHFVVCPNNSGHRLPENKLAEHLETCNWVSEGYRSNEPSFSISYPGGSSIQMNPELQEDIIRNAAAQDPNFKTGSSTIRPVPKTSNCLQKLFTCDERRALYDYVVAKTEQAVKIADAVFVEPEKPLEKKELSELEIAAAERDARRRRATYRNKVHTNRKTHVEIMREVIESQMNCLLKDLPDDISHHESLEKNTEPIRKRDNDRYKSTQCSSRSRDDSSRYKSHRSRERERSRSRHYYKEENRNIRDRKEKRHRSERKSRSEEEREYKKKREEQKSEKKKVDVSGSDWEGVEACSKISGTFHGVENKESTTLCSENVEHPNDSIYKDLDLLMLHKEIPRTKERKEKKHKHNKKKKKKKHKRKRTDSSSSSSS